MSSNADRGAFEARGSKHDARESSCVRHHVTDKKFTIDTKSLPKEKESSKTATKKAKGIDTESSSKESGSTKQGLAPQKGSQSQDISYKEAKTDNSRNLIATYPKPNI